MGNSSEVRVVLVLTMEQWQSYTTEQLISHAIRQLQDGKLTVEVVVNSGANAPVQGVHNSAV